MRLSGGVLTPSSGVPSTVKLKNRRINRECSTIVENLINVGQMSVFKLPTVATSVELAVHQGQLHLMTFGRSLSAN